MTAYQLFLTEMYTCRRQGLRSTPWGSVSNCNPAETLARGAELLDCGGGSLVWGVAVWKVRNVAENSVTIGRKLVVLENMISPSFPSGFSGFYIRLDISDWRSES